MHGFKGERVLMRIHVDERDKFHGKPLYAAIVDLLRKRHYAGATVCAASWDSARRPGCTPTGSIFLAFDLRVIVECVETEENILAVLPDLDEMIGSGLITLERAKVIMYRPHRPGRRARRGLADRYHGKLGDRHALTQAPVDSRYDRHRAHRTLYHAVGGPAEREMV